MYVEKKSSLLLFNKMQLSPYPVIFTNVSKVLCCDLRYGNGNMYKLSKESRRLQLLNIA